MIHILSEEIPGDRFVVVFKIEELAQNLPLLVCAFQEVLDCHGGGHLHNVGFVVLFLTAVCVLFVDGLQGLLAYQVGFFKFVNKPVIVQRGLCAVVELVAVDGQLLAARRFRHFEVGGDEHSAEVGTGGLGLTIPNMARFLHDFQNAGDSGRAGSAEHRPDNHHTGFLPLIYIVGNLA